MTKSIIVIMTTVLLFMSTHGVAGEITVTWKNPETFSDVRAANESQSKFRDRVIAKLTKHWQEQAEQLPDGIKLEIVMTNLNLAGQVEYSFAMNRDIRVVKNLYWPRMSFEYKLLDGKSVINKGQEQLSDMMFMDRGNLRSNRDVYSYEKRIISDWFVDHVPVMLAQWQQHRNAVMSE